MGLNKKQCQFCILCAVKSNRQAGAILNSTYPTSHGELGDGGQQGWYASHAVAVIMQLKHYYPMVFDKANLIV